MSLLQASNISKRFGVVELFSNLTFSVNERERVALIGANGSGKTTLLKIVIGEEEPSYNGEDKKAGVVTLMRDKTLGYLSQHVISNLDNSLIEEVKDVFKREIQLNEDFTRITHELSLDVHNEKLMEKYEQLLAEMETLNAFDYLYQIKAILSHFGFSESDYERQIASFSGGERTKISFAKLILTKPDLLILDEPTNHLDVSTIEWLTKYLNTYQGAVLFVSHDRYFIDDVATRILELENNTLTSYTGNYEQYVIEKKNNAELLLRQYKIQQKEIAKLEWFIKFYMPKPRFASRAKDRQKKLAKIERISIPKTSNNKLKLHLETPLKNRKKLALFSEISLGYSQTLVEPFSFYLFSGDKFAVMGDNGTGKSTLLKAILGEVELMSGAIEFARKFKIGYLKQSDFDFGTSLTPYEVISQIRPMMGRTEVRSHLGRFGFYEDEVFKAISNLSGGELMRLNLAKLVLSDYELLLLDEPTNNLDILTRDALIDALKDYQGALIIVSHDRHLVNQVCDHIIYFHQGEALLVEGDYSDVKEQLIDKEEIVEEVKPAVVVPQKKKMTNNARVKLQSEIAAFEARLNEIHLLMTKDENYDNYQLHNELEIEQKAIESKLLVLLETLEQDNQ